jgi:hypothetical protein
VNPLAAFSIAVVLFAGFRVPFFAGFVSAIVPLSSARFDGDDTSC